ncbi:ATP-dependent RNA helicase DDX51 [Amphibalanus amphitrite]|uniref:ATP-dependent RNA helicase DDX51 n=1 Tax=Amphibalanus amphitrite TaxID=1232801 RepID=A0A6A4X447_AMPAM|nr:ATP-dependent RNA helicase DDX51 [Amphibalanus amphitrite]
MARGIDVDAVDAVVSYDTPALLKAHCVRRTARVSRAGRAVTLMFERQRSHFQRLMAQAGKADGRVRETPVPLYELRQYEATYLARLRQHVTQPTRGPNFLDLVLTTALQTETTVRDGTFPSDHLEVVCEFRAVTLPTPQVTRSKALNYKRADWDGMRAALRLVPWSLLNNLPVDDATEKFYDVLTSAIRDPMPSVTLSRRHPAWFDRELRGQPSWHKRRRLIEL